MIVTAALFHQMETCRCLVQHFIFTHFLKLNLAFLVSFESLGSPLEFRIKFMFVYVVCGFEQRLGYTACKDDGRLKRFISFV